MCRQPECYLWTHNRWKRSHEEYNLRLDPTTGIVNLTDSVEELRRKRNAARIGDWKLIRFGIETPDDHYELYNIAQDPGEEHDRAAEYPDKVEELKAVMEREHLPNHNFPLFAGE